MILPVRYKDGGYDIVLSRGALLRAGELLFLKRRVLIVTDDGVPAEYAASVAEKCELPTVVTLPQGEGSKSFEKLQMLLETMLNKGFDRRDCVCAVGGGVVGDLAGFASSIYMRGVDFYNIPTTLLSQVDSSIGGKTAIDFCGIKNIVGCFKRPEKVLIDPDLLRTLDRRQFAAGMAEALKMGATSDETLFEIIEKQEIEKNLDVIIERALRVKKAVVESDERESGQRRILNFGHTIGHGIESSREGELLHGECVALGMIPMCGKKARERLIPVLVKLGLPVRAAFDEDAVMAAVRHDKKSNKEKLTVVNVESIGSCTLEEVPYERLKGSLETIRAGAGKE